MLWIARNLIFPMLLLFSASFSLHAQMVAPYASPWDYGENRCLNDKFGYASEALALAGGAQRHYNFGGCPPEVVSVEPWPTAEAPRYKAACGGSTNVVPFFKHGVEYLNTKWASIHYWYKSCSYPPTGADGLVLLRQRTVECPPGYGWGAGGKPECIRQVIDPNKHCHDNCVSGGNPSNPIQTALGTKLQAEIDFDMGRGLKFSRHYASYRSWSESALGSNWRHNYEARLSVVSGPSMNGERTVWAQRPEGDRYWFIVSAAGDISHDPDVSFALNKTTDAQGVENGWSLLNISNDLEIYDLDGRLVAVNLADGHRVDLLYEGTRLVEVKDESGRMIRLSYDAEGRVESANDSSGQAYRYKYDASGNLTEASYPDSTPSNVSDNPVRIYHYEQQVYPFINALTGITDEGGGRFASWQYEAFNAPWAGMQIPRAILSVHGPLSGAVDRVELKFLGDGSTEIIDPLGKAVKYQFSAVFGSRKIASASAPCAGCGDLFASMSYDSRGFVASKTNFNGIATALNHNDRGLETARIDAANSSLDTRTTQTDWHPDFRVPTERRTYDAANTLVAKSTWTYNPRGQALTQARVDPASGATRTTTTTYCEQPAIDAGSCPLLGLVTSVDGPRTDVGDLTTYTYYPSDDATCAAAPTTCPHRKGDLWKVTNALGQVAETLRYDGAGRVRSVKDANGVVTDLEYHPRGWLAARKLRGSDNASEADDQITRIDYWPTGLVQQVTQPDGAFTSYTYDAAHRLTDIADNAGNTLHYTLDNAGNRVREDTKDAGGLLKRTLSRVYNQLGQLQTQADAQANPTDFTYDANGNPDTVTDALGRKTDHDYDPLNRLVRTLQDVGGLAAASRFEYDAQDNLTQVIDPKGLATAYQYTGLGDLAQQVESVHVQAPSYRCEPLLAQLFGRQDVRSGVRPRLSYGG